MGLRIRSEIIALRRIYYFVAPTQDPMANSSPARSPPIQPPIQAVDPHGHSSPAQLPFVQPSYPPAALSRCDTIPEYPGRLHGWHTERKGHPSPTPSSPILVPTAPASPTLPVAPRNRIVETTGRCKGVDPDSIRSKLEGMIANHEVCRTLLC